MSTSAKPLLPGILAVASAVGTRWTTASHLGRRITHPRACRFLEANPYPVQRRESIRSAA
jgi:hypothetical protein